MRLRSSTGRAAPIEASEAPPTAGEGRPRLRDLLLRSGALTPEDVQTVLEAQQRTGRLFGETCLDLGLCDAASIQTALNTQFGHAPVPPDSDAVDPEVTVAFGSDPEFAENMRALRARLLGRRVERGETQASLVFIGADQNVRVAPIAANFAVASAQLGYAVLLVDAALDRAAQHQLFRRPNRTGLSAVLRRGDDIMAAVQETAVANLSLLPAGPAVPNAAEFFEHGSLAAALPTLSPPFDLVVVDAGGGSPDISASLAVGLDGAVVVMARHRTAMRHVRRLSDRLADRGVERLGAIIA